jgi:hypothetical protein
MGPGRWVAALLLGTLVACGGGAEPDAGGGPGGGTATPSSAGPSDGATPRSTPQLDSIAVMAP